jgi:hypothetical protein
VVLAAQLVQQEPALQVVQPVQRVQQEPAVQVDMVVILQLGNIHPTPTLIKIQQMAILD